MALPTIIQPPKAGYPSMVLISSAPGVGKSSLFPGLNMNDYKCLHIDLQDGVSHVGGLVLNVKEIAIEKKIPLYQAFFMCMREIREANIAAGEKVYDFGVFDPLSTFKQMTTEYSAYIYNSSIVGKAAARKSAEEKFGKDYTAAQLNQCYSKDPVADLGQNGWNFYNTAYKQLYEATIGLFGHCTFYIAHTKYNTLKKGVSEELAIKEIDFWPAYLLQLIGEASDSGALHREGNKVLINFILKTDQAHFKSRYFDGKEILLSTKGEDGTITTYWDNIFPFLKEQKHEKVDIQEVNS